jgi:hypothetical protein
LLRNRDADGTIGSRVNDATLHESGQNDDTGFIGASRASSLTHSVKSASEYDQDSGNVSDGTDSNSIYVFGINWSVSNLISNGTIAFYSIGTAVDLEDLDTAVTNLMADITFFFNTGLNPADYDTETVRYVNAGYAAGGTLE